MKGGIGSVRGIEGEGEEGLSRMRMEGDIGGAMGVDDDGGVSCEGSKVPSQLERSLLDGDEGDLFFTRSHSVGKPSVIATRVNDVSALSKLFVNS